MHPRWYATAVVTLACAPSPPTDIAGDYYVNGVGSIGGRCVVIPPDADLFASYWSQNRFFGGSADALEVTTDGPLTEIAFHDGAVADYLDTFVGSTSFMGSMRDGQLDATIVGTKVFEYRLPPSASSCAYAVDARLEITFSSLLFTADSTVPTLNGVIVSTPRAISGGCAQITACSEHAFVTVVEATRLP